jgi:hypothetical protein
MLKLHVYVAAWELRSLRRNAVLVGAPSTDTVQGVANPDDDEHGKILEAARRPERVRSQAAQDNDF